MRLLSHRTEAALDLGRRARLVQRVRVDHERRPQVEGLALGQQAAELREPRLGVEAGEQRTRFGGADPGRERLGARAQVDQGAAGEQALHDARLRRRAASERHDRPPARDRLDRLALALAEARLALAGEQLRDAAARGALDRAIEVHERQAEPRREQRAHGGLAGPHHSHQPQRAVAHGANITKGRMGSCPIRPSYVCPSQGGDQLPRSGFTTTRGVTKTRSSWRTSRVSVFLKTFPITGILWKYGTRDWRSAERTT